MSLDTATRAIHAFIDPHILQCHAACVFFDCCRSRASCPHAQGRRCAARRWHARGLSGALAFGLVVDWQPETCGAAVVPCRPTALCCAVCVMRMLLCCVLILA
jgi:hypothetical protein